MGNVQKPTGDEHDKALAGLTQERAQGLFAPKEDAPAPVGIQQSEKPKARNRRSRGLSLRTKLVLGFLAVTIIPLTIFTFLNDRNMRNTLTADANQELVNAASLTTVQLDTFTNNSLETIRTAANIPYIGDFISSPDRLKLSAKVTSILTAFARQNAVYIYSVAVLDIRGENLADTSTGGIGTNESEHDYFIKAIETGRPFASDVEFSQTTPGIASIYFSAPVHDPAGKIIGVIRTRYNALVLQYIVTANNNLTGQGSFAQLVTRQSHLRLAHGKTSSYNYTTVVSLDAATVGNLQAQRLLPPGTPAELSTDLPGFDAALKNYKNQSIFVTELEDGDTKVEQGAIVKMKTQEWLVVYSQEQDVFLAPINTQARNNIVFAVVIGLAVVFLGLFMAQTLAGPIARLTQTAEKISAGDIFAQAKVESRDEIGTLAGAFNNMTAQLREFITTLEQRVSARTLELETVNQQNTRRAAQFESIAQTARSMTTLQNLSSLLPRITELVSQQFGFYHVGIFLLDDKQEYAVLAAANSTGGQQMIKRGHKLKIGQVGIVGYAAGRGNARIALDTGLDATYFDNPELPDTRSEMALPLKLGKRVIGVLDVQSLDSSAFSNDDIASLTILADQVSIAIENTRQYEATLKTLEQTEATYRQYVQREWTRLAREENLTGYRYIAGSSSRLEAPVDLGDIKAVVTAGRIYQGDGEKTGAADFAVPVKLRGEVIGVLSISAAGKNRWSDDDIDIVEAVAERLALSIENARLFQVTTNRAERERVVSEIASKISGNLRMDSLLRTTAQELSLAMNGSEVLIQLQTVNQPGGQQ